MTIDTKINLEYCNICEKEIDNIDEHISSIEHKNNIDRLMLLFKNKVYNDDRIGVEP